MSVVSAKKVMWGDKASPAKHLPPGFCDAPALEGHLQHWADQRPEAPALRDPGNRQALGLGPLRRLDYWSVNKIVSRLAGLFADQGLSRGDIIAIQLANTVELPITILAAMRAGLVPCLLPLLWRKHELTHVFQTLPIKAIVCQGNHSDYSYGEMMCALAEEHLTVRFLYGAGGGLPDGIMPLSEVFDRPAGRDLGRPFFKPYDLSPNDPAAVLFATGPDGHLTPLWRTHGELISSGLMHAVETGITSRDRLLNPFPLSSLTGLVSMFVPWLLSGASLVQHDPFEEAGFLKDLADDEITYAILPSPVFKTHYEAGTLQTAAPSLSRVGCVWTPKRRSFDGSSDEDVSFSISSPVMGPSGTPLPVYDILSLGDFASIVVPRQKDRRPDTLPLGPIRLPQKDPNGPVMLETRLKGSLQKAGIAKQGRSTLTGRLLVRGPLVPMAAYALWNNVGNRGRSEGTDGWLNTGLRASIVDGQMDAVVCETDPGTIYHGGVMLSAADLDRIYAEFVDFADAAAFTISDPLVGDRIFAAVVPSPGLAPSMKSFKKYLQDRAVAPYKVPEKLVVVSMIPRDDEGHVLRNEILSKI